MFTRIKSIKFLSPFFLITALVFAPNISADLRANGDRCYLTAGHGDNIDFTIALIKKLSLNYKSLELFERKDKKVYVTFGKVDKKLFEVFKNQNKLPEGFYCSRGKGFLKRYNLTKDLRLYPGDKRFIDSESDLLIALGKNINKTNSNTEVVQAENETNISNNSSAATVKEKPRELPIKEINIDNFKLMHPIWYSNPSNHLEGQFSAASCSVIRGGDFEIAKNNAMNNARKDINTFLGNTQEVSSDNRNNYLNTIQAGVYLSKTEQVYINDLPFYCVLASISYLNVKKIQESQLSVSRTVEQIQSELMLIVDKKIDLAARGVLYGAKDFRDIYRNFNSYTDYGDYKLADEMFYKFIELDTEAFDAHKNFLYKMQAYKSKKEIQEIYKSLKDKYPLNKSIELAYESTKNPISYLIALRNMVAADVSFLPSYYEFYSESDTVQETFFIPSMSSAKITALAKLVDVGEFNLVRYYPFSGEEVRKNYKWYPSAYQNFKQVTNNQNQPLVLSASRGAEGIQVYFSGNLIMYALEVDYSIDGGPFKSIDRSVESSPYGIYASTIKQSEDNISKYKKMLIHPELSDGSGVVNASEKYLLRLISTGAYSKERIEQFRTQQVQKIEQLIEGTNNQIEMYKKMAQQQSSIPQCQNIKNLITNEEICLKNYFELPGDSIKDKNQHSITLRITDILEEVSFKTGNIQLLY